MHLGADVVQICSEIRENHCLRERGRERWEQPPAATSEPEAYYLEPVQLFSEWHSLYVSEMNLQLNCWMCRIPL